MDKELLRVVIIATGLVVIVGMLFWTFLKNRQSEQDEDLFDMLKFKRGTADKPAKTPKAAKTADAPLSPKKAPRYRVEDNDDDEVDDLFADFDFGDNSDEYEQEEKLAAPRFILPDIIQFSIVARSPDGFNGMDLFNAFQIVGLEYGSLKIFERLDANRLVDFGVACMVEPGTFPSNHLDSFFCPGIVFFMQPAALGDALPVFDDFVDTIKLLAIELDGDILDHQRAKLSDATVELIRHSL